jgi:alkyl sulfatase BDS1-like metallo-beta-lactamase superfamily hydrolase
MQRYVDMNGYNSIINSRQFGTPVAFPKEYKAPNLTYSDKMTLRVGEYQFVLTHAKGETDDHTWIWIPKARIVYTGDLFIWAAPNAGNPQKVQRYVIEWARALRQMADRKPALLLPGHGFPIEGESRVAQALNDTASYLESLHQQTVAMMNRGATIYDIIATVKPPADLAARPYLKAVYDEPEFITRTIWRLYGGWYSGVPSEVKPAPRAEQGRELAQLSGGVAKLIERANALAADGNLPLACHLIDWATDAEPNNTRAHESRAAIYTKRTASESSTMSKGIFGAAARDSLRKAKG